MKRFFRRFICLFLCLCMVVQPMLIQALYAEETKIYEGGNTRESITNKLNGAANEVSTNLNQSRGEISKATSDTKASNASDSKKIEALGEVDKASANTNEAQISAQGIGAASSKLNAVTQQNGSGSVGEMTSETAGIQDTLIKIGNSLISIGRTLKTVGQALQAVGIAMQAFPFTAPAGKVLETVGIALYRVGTVLDAVGQVLVKTGQVAAGSDDIFGTLLGDVTNAVKDGWKKGGEEANAYSAELNSKLSKNNPSASQENSSTETKDSESETTKDAEQGDIADI